MIELPRLPSMRARERKERIAEAIRARPIDPDRERINRVRMILCAEALRNLQANGVVRYFLQTGKLDYSDLEEGIDVYVVVVSGGRYVVHPLSVTGPKFLEAHRARHPYRKQVVIFGNEPVWVIEGRILKALGVT